MARSTGGRAAAGAVLPCRVLVAAEIAEIAYQNKAVVYDLLFKVSADVMMTIAADPKHLGAKIAITSVLHTWGSAMMHHPHVHMIVPGGGLSTDGSKWVRASAKFLLPVRVLSALFRRRMIEALVTAHRADKLQFFNELARLADAQAFADHLEPLKAKRWHVYAKRPFGGPRGRARLSRPLHASRRDLFEPALIAIDGRGVTFKVQGLQDRRSRPTQNDDCAPARVHPALPHPRAAEGPAPHPPLRPLGQRPARGQPRPRRASCCA